MFYVAYLETEPCYFYKVVFKSFDKNECRKFIKESRRSDLWILNKLEEIEE